MVDERNAVEIFRSWRAIARYLNCDVPTIRRWERMGLPIRHSRTTSGSTVTATRSGIDDWVKGNSRAQSELKAGPRTFGPGYDPSGWRFLMTEIGCGLTFISMALSAQPEERERFRRNVRNARKAYEAVRKFRHRIHMEEAATAELNNGLNRLEKALQDLGGFGPLHSKVAGGD